MIGSGNAYILEEDGISMLQINIRKMGPVDPILKAITKAQPSTVRNLAWSPDKTRIHMSVVGETVTLYSVMQQLIFKTWWFSASEAGIEKPFFIPTFDQRNGEDMTFAWTPPSDVRLYYALSLTEGNQGRLTQYSEALGAFNISKKGMWRLPIPNLHNNAMICSGNSGIDMGLDKISLYHASWARFRATNWNLDLANAVGDSREQAVGYAQKFLRFHADGTQVKPVEHPLRRAKEVSFAALNVIDTNLPIQ